MGSPALEVRALARRHRTTPWGRPRRVLEGIELVLEPGAALGLLGPNGSGKSTLLRILAGVERPSSGVVRVFGASIEDRAARRRLGYLPDGFPFPGELGARAVLEFLGGLHGWPRARRRARAEAMLARVGLADEARTPLARFSLGMKRRFALAAALLASPDLLLFDEPSAGLDAPGDLVLDELLEEARARGAALVLASHVVADLEQHCTRVAVLFGGRLAAQGPTAELAGDRARLLTLYRRLAEGHGCSA